MGVLFSPLSAMSHAHPLQSGFAHPDGCGMMMIFEPEVVSPVITQVESGFNHFVHDANAIEFAPTARSVTDYLVSPALWYHGDAPMVESTFGLA